MEYAQARMQGRHGARADEALWRRLAVHEGFEAYLAAARATSLVRWLGAIGVGADAHAIELELRRCWRTTVSDLARWMPPEWQAAVRWCAPLVDLPALAWIAAVGGAFPWMEQDAALIAAVERVPPRRAEWYAAWRRLWPVAAGPDADALERLKGVIETHLLQFSRLAPEEAPAARRALGREAVRNFRQQAFRPPSAFAYLLLVALELERLRAELVLRALQLESA